MEAKIINDSENEFQSNANALKLTRIKWPTLKISKTRLKFFSSHETSPQFKSLKLVF